MSDLVLGIGDPGFGYSVVVNSHGPGRAVGFFQKRMFRER